MIQFEWDPAKAKMNLRKHSVDKSDKEIDKLWAKEVEDRIDAYDQGKIKAISLEKVLNKYR